MWQVNDNKFVIRVWEPCWVRLQELMAELVKRAEKLKLDPMPGMEVVREESVKVWDDVFTMREGEYTLRKLFWVEVTSVAMKLAGWRFAGTIEHTDGVGNIIRMFDFNLQAPAEFRERDAVCDHCGYKRKRRDTYLVYNDETGDWKQVGSTCIVDFTGSTNAETYASWFHDLWDLYESLEAEENLDPEDAYGDGGDGLYSRRVHNLTEFLAYVAHVIEHHGWVSRAKAEYDYDFRRTGSTSDQATTWWQTRRDDEGRYEAFLPEEKHWEEARAAIAWAASLSEDERQSDYMNNLYVLANNAGMEWRDRGLAASMVASYQRHLQRLKEAAVVKDSQHVGTLKVRQEFTVQVLDVRLIETMYGDSHLHRMVDEAGNLIIWFASTTNDMEVGHTYRVKATPKKHDEYKGTKQTTVTRVAVIKEVE